MIRPRRAAGAAAIALALTAGVQGARAQDAAIPDGDWRLINRDLTATRFSPLDQINRSNVGQLQLAWRYELDVNSTAVPIVIGGVMYVPNGGQIVALDAEQER